MRDLTPQQISSIWHAQSASGGRSFEDIIRAAIRADRELNGRTGEVQPAREWVGLTDGERLEQLHGAFPLPAAPEEVFLEGMRVAESNLREKNAGLHAAVPDGYAGVMVWIGGSKAAQIVTEAQIKHERETGQSITHAAQRCLDMLAAALKPQATTPDDHVQAVLSEIFTDTEAPHKIDVLFSSDSRDVTVVYSNLDCQWLEELKDAVAQRAMPSDDHPLMHSKPAKPQAPDMEAGE